MEAKAPTTEGSSPLEKQAQDRRAAWFTGLPSPEKHQIIKKAFEQRYPTDAAKREALKEY